MTGNEYQKEALRTLSPIRPNIEEFQNASENEYKDLVLVEGAMGLCGEAGECLELLKKSIFQGHPLYRKDMVEELGDVAWYLAVSAWAIGYDLEDIFKSNLKKLEKRYPNGFEEERSVNRDKDI